MPPQERKILVLGAVGQIGTDLTPALRQRYGPDSVVAVGHRTMPTDEFLKAGPFETVDATDKEGLRALVRKHEIGAIYHMATILSGDGEMDPDLAWHVNVDSLKNVLDLGVL